MLHYSTRFDLIFLMLDPQDEAYDRRLAHHLVSLYYQSEEQMEEEFLDMAVLRDYIAYARTYINPRLSEEASQALIEVCSLRTDTVSAQIEYICRNVCLLHAHWSVSVMHFNLTSRTLFLRLMWT